LTKGEIKYAKEEDLLRKDAAHGRASDL
jgi:hypothetical protein